MSAAFVDLALAPGALRIEYRWLFAERADAPLLVFLHEGLGSVSMWRDFPERLCAAGEYRGLLYSRPGYGQSTPRAHDQPWTPRFMHEQAHDVLPALLAALGVHEPVWLFGHSDGGSIALLHAAQFAPRVRGAIVLAPHLFVEDLSVANIARARQAYLHGDLRAKLARHHADVDSAFYGWNDIWLAPAFRAWNIESELARLRCPVLAMQGVDDEYGTLRQIERIAELVPGTALLTLANCGHSPHRDQPERVIEATRAFLR